MCKSKSTDPNPITRGEDREELYAQIVWLKGSPGNPESPFCKICFTCFKFSYKRDYPKASDLLEVFQGPDGHSLYAGWFAFY